MSIIGHHVGILIGIVIAVVRYLLSFVIVYVMALVVDALAPTFDGQKNQPNALKLATYSMTPVWLAGALSLIPGLRPLGILGLYGVYLFWLGVPVLMKAPNERSTLYTGAVAICGVGTVQRIKASLNVRPPEARLGGRDVGAKAPGLRLPRSVWATPNQSRRRSWPSFLFQTLGTRMFLTLPARSPGRFYRQQLVDTAPVAELWPSYSPGMRK